MKAAVIHRMKEFMWNTKPHLLAVFFDGKKGKPFADFETKGFSFREKRNESF